MRFDARYGPVQLVLERPHPPQPGERFRVAVFVCDRWCGVVAMTTEQWAAFIEGSEHASLQVTP